MKVTICRACGKISTPDGARSSSKDCQLSKHKPCDWEAHEMQQNEVNAYCERKGWRPIFD